MFAFKPRCYVALCALMVMNLCIAEGRAESSPLVAPPMPTISARTFSVMDFGAVGDGKTMNTVALNKAIAAANEAGGGKVIVPKGRFLTGPIQLLSGVELNLDAAATILLSRNPSDFPLVVGLYEGTKQVRCQSPVWAEGAHDIAITGHGIIDGSGDAWRLVHRRSVPTDVWDQLLKSGGIVVGDRATTLPDYSGIDPSQAKKPAQTWYPSNESRDADGLKKLREGPDALNPLAWEKYRFALRPTMVELVDCNRVLLDGPTFRNSPNWNLHPLYTHNLTVRNVTIFNESWAANGDGIDIDSCRDVLMTNCSVNAGDDGICIKSGRDAQGRAMGKPTENVSITRCTVGHAHGGFVIGSEMSGGVKNIECSDCTFTGTDVGLRFKTTRGRGGVVENIHVDNIRMSQIKNEAVLFDMYYMIKGARGAKREVKPVDETTPSFRDIHVSNLTCDGCQQAILLSGLPELPLMDVTMENLKITHAATSITVEDCNAITLRHVGIGFARGELIQQGEKSNCVLEDVKRLAD